MGKPTISIDDGTMTVSSGADQEVVVDDETRAEEINKLILRRQEIGVELSKKLNDYGLIAADDNQATIIRT